MSDRIFENVSLEIDDLPARPRSLIRLAELHGWNVAVTVGTSIVVRLTTEDEDGRYPQWVMAVWAPRGYGWRYLFGTDGDRDLTLSEVRTMAEIDGPL